MDKTIKDVINEEDNEDDEGDDDEEEEEDEQDFETYSKALDAKAIAAAKREQ